jgi:hypothetical protein
LNLEFNSIDQPWKIIKGQSFMTNQQTGQLIGCQTETGLKNGQISQVLFNQPQSISRFGSKSNCFLVADTSEIGYFF